MGAMCILFFFVDFFFLFFHVFSFLFWYFPFSLLRFLSVFSVFFDFVAISFRFATHFAKFHVAVSQISRLSSVLRLFLSILLLFSIIFRFCGLFLAIGCMLLSFRYISFRFCADLMF